ncbi:MAG: hypothetical protein LBV23_10000, partial [Deltaproteobacteria bacterium]|nr:hypothetical protein [Deltaproteobacteria bacterium]
MKILAKLLILILVVAWPSLGCGVKTHPWPEMETLPGAVVDLTHELDEGGRVWLNWLTPSENVSGRPLKTLDHFEVWGADYDMNEFCPGCPSKTVKLADVFLEAPPPGLELAKGPYRWETKVRPNRVYV